ncbi:hypothetical protein COCON_G00020690 [Conger conger]|uniref:C2H2-type domain-containing protein n=1 Tax=Conger conger TaxID=82655 RepID=A0A9Q1DWS1_CONCO|nr:hypothetical protein COCON_G00020690 [Conger conger]
MSETTKVDVQRIIVFTQELHFCTPLSSSMMQAGVCLRQDTETTLPELTEQHRIRLKEEELSGLESETECAAPGLNTLEPECVTAHSGVSDVHHTHTSVIKTEADLGSTRTGDLIKTKSLDFTELGYVTHLHPDQIKTEAEDGGYHKAEHISDLLDIKCVDVKSDQMKCESSESLVSDLMNTVMDGAGVDHKGLPEPWLCAGEPTPNCEKEEIHQNNRNRIVQKSRNCNKKHMHCQRVNVRIAPKISQNTSHLHVFQNKMIQGKNHTNEKPYKCTQCGKCFFRMSHLSIHQRIHTGEKPYKCFQCGKCFSIKSNLQCHLRIHTGEKPYKCFQCGKCFSMKSNLQCHLKIHTGEKPHKCTQCDKGFITNSDLNKHLRIHTGEKPYKCTQCDKCLHSNSALHYHMRLHAGEN